MDSWENRFFYNERRVEILILKKEKMQKKLEKLFGKSLKLTLFIFFTIIWSLFVQLQKEFLKKNMELVNNLSNQIR